MVESQRRPLILVHLLVALIVMVLTSFLPSATPTTTHNQHSSRHDDQHKKKKKRPPAHEPPPSKSAAAAAAAASSSSSSSSSSWHQLKSLLSCRSAAAAAVAPQIHDPPANKLGRTAAACGASICAIRDVVHGNTRVVHRSDTDLSSVSDAGSMSQRETAPLAGRSVSGRSARHAQPVFLSGCGGTYSRGAALPLRKLSGCAECRAVSVEPSSRRYPRPRELCACQQCGEVFTKSESLELHQAIRHAVSELGPEDSGRNIVEIIFKSSWQKKDRPIVQIERILKVHNAPRTVARFEDYRSSIKSHALLLHHLAAGGGAAAALRHHHYQQPLPAPPQQQQKKNPRCAADGNELLRFHCTALSCSLGARGATSLCANSSSSSATPCVVCTIIRHGFAKAGGHLQHHPLGVRTTASSGRAHDHGPPAAGPGELRAMLVCRVIAGRIRRPGEESPSSSAAAAEDGGYDSVAGELEGGTYGNLEELFVANPRAILPCFVVIYRALD